MRAPYLMESSIKRKKGKYRPCNQAGFRTFFMWPGESKLVKGKRRMRLRRR